MKKFLTISILALLVIGLMCSCDSNANVKKEKENLIEYLIKYKDAGGSEFSGTHGENYPTKHTYGKETSLVDPTKTGYTFDGWYLTSDCSGDVVTTLGANEYTDVITLYAKWTAKEYSISYKDAGGTDFSGTHGANHPTKHTYGTETTLVEPATKEGYVFDGWYLTSDCSGDAVTTLGANEYTDVITLYAKWTEYASLLLNGTFKVGSSKTVKFTRGNMYWDGDSFEIEKEQWDYQDGYSANHVSHFYYSTDAAVARAESYDDSSKATTDILFTNATETTANSSFTVAGETGKYRSLSKDEWDYLMNTRTVNGGTGEGHSFQRAKVNSVNGLILYPDGYTNQVTNSFAGSNWNTAPTVTKENWAVMKTAGCVFMPAAGYRNGSSLYNVGTNGYVWTASPYSGGSNYAYNVYFGSYAVSVSSNDVRNNGRSVRLVVQN